MNIKSTIEHFLADCEIRGLSQTTVAWYRKRLNLVASKLAEVDHVTEMEAVKIVHLRHFVQHLMTTHSGANNPRKPTESRFVSPYTVRGYVRVIKVFFSWCYKEELTDSDPSARLVQPKAPDYLIPTFTVDHIDKMLATCNLKTPGGFRDYVILLLLLDTGMRVSELCSLRVCNVFERYVKVIGKGNKEREIGLHPHVGRLLCRYLYKYRPPVEGVETVFVGRGGIPLQQRGVAQMLDRVKKASGIEGVRVSAHTFRHTFAKFYLKRGGELFDLSREMGHSTVQITEIYLKDYRSTEARKRHPGFSLIEEVQLQEPRKRGRTQNKP
jgi:integrase/recombinase XerD